MRRMVWWLMALTATLMSATCAVKTEKREALRVDAADTPTAADFPAPLIIDGVRGCAKVMSFEGIETCPEDGVTMLCVRKNDTPPVIPPGAHACGTAMITGGQCRTDGKLVRFRCDAVVGMPTPTPTPDQNPLAACQEKRPGFCWTRGAFADGQCFASCECGPRLANTVCVGPVWGAPTPRPTQKPTPRPSIVPTASPTPPADPLAPCRDKRPGWCWTSGLFAGQDCFSSCRCEQRLANTVCVGPSAGTPTPRPTSSPSPTVKPTAKPSPAPTGCPAGQHAEQVWMCVADQPTPRPTNSPTPAVTARPTASPRPTTLPTSSASPRPVPTATPPVVPSSQALDGVWFVPECTRANGDGTRDRWYFWPYVWAAYPKGWNKHVLDNAGPCVATREVWNAAIAIPYHWQKPDQANIDAARPQVAAVVAALNERKMMIEQMKQTGVPADRIPKMPILWVAETAATNYGFYVDSGGGFYTVKDGKRVLRPATELPRVLPAYVEWMIEEYKKAGATDFSDAPYVFFWAADTFAKMDAMQAGSSKREDYRGRDLAARPPQRTNKMMGTGSAAVKAQLTQNNPTLWPAGYAWKVNPANTTEPYMNVDTPDAQAAKRDSTYYLLYLYALKGQHPEITYLTPQISNCGYNKPNDSPWWEVSKNVQQFNAVMGYRAEAQIEGCQAKANLTAGKAWNAPYADCRALQSIRAYKGGLMSMWLPNVQDAAGLDAQLKNCPVSAALTTADTVPGVTAEEILREVGLPD